MIPTLAALAWLASSQAVSEVSAAPEARQITDDAMRFVAKDDMDGLFAFMAERSLIPKKQMDDSRANIIAQRKAIFGTYGKVLGFAFASECRRSNTLVRLIYIERRENSVMRWVFIMYKAKDAWRIAYFYWDDKVPEIFAPC